MICLRCGKYIEGDRELARELGLCQCPRSPSQDLDRPRPYGTVDEDDAYERQRRQGATRGTTRSPN